MSYYKAKSIKIDKKNNKISGEFADSCWRDYKGNFIYDKIDDLYPNLKTLEDKIACLYYDLICGNIHTSLKKYTDLVLLFNCLGNFTEDFRKASVNENKKDFDLYKVYLKYKDEIEKYTKKDCVLRDKTYQHRYIVRVNKTSVSLNYDKERAKKFNSNTIKNNKWFMENFEIEYI